MVLYSNTKTRNLIFLVFITLNFNSLKAQKIYFYYDIILKTNISKPNKLFLLGNESEMYYSVINKKDTLIIENNRNSFLIKNKKLNNINFDEVKFFKNLVVINAFKKAYLFKKNKNDFFLIDSVIHNYDKVEIIDSNRLLFFKNYNYHPNSCPPDERTRLGIYDIKYRKFIYQKNIAFDYIFFTHLISNYIDISPDRKKIVVSHALPYKLDIYDVNLNILNTINGNIVYEKLKINELQKMEDSMTKNNISSKKFIQILSKKDKNINRIIKIYFLDDSTLLVIKKMSEDNKNGNERNIDVWRFKENNWYLIVDNQKYHSSWIKKNKNNFKIHIPFMQSEQLIVKNGHIFVSSGYFPFHEFKNFDDLVNHANSVDYTNLKCGIVKFKDEIK